VAKFVASTCRVFFFPFNTSMLIFRFLFLVHFPFYAFFFCLSAQKGQKMGHDEKNFKLSHAEAYSHFNN
jgi:hypothetical protein